MELYVLLLRFSGVGAANRKHVIVVCKTDPDCSPPHDGMSLLLVETGTPGFEKGRNLKKLGLKGQDTSEMSFTA